MIHYLSIYFHYRRRTSRHLGISNERRTSVARTCNSLDRKILVIVAPKNVHLHSRGFIGDRESERMARTDGQVKIYSGARTCPGRSWKNNRVTRRRIRGGKKEENDCLLEAFERAVMGRGWFSKGRLYVTPAKDSQYSFLPVSPLRSLSPLLPALFISPCVVSVSN